MFAAFTRRHSRSGYSAVSSASAWRRVASENVGALDWVRGEIGFIGLSFSPLGCPTTPGAFAILRGRCPSQWVAGRRVHELCGRYHPLLVLVPRQQVLGVAVEHR